MAIPQGCNPHANIKHMEIKNEEKVVITGRHVMVVAAIISLLCCGYWAYRSLVCQDEQWLNVALTAAVGVGLLFLARKRK